VVVEKVARNEYNVQQEDGTLVQSVHTNNLIPVDDKVRAAVQCACSVVATPALSAQRRTFCGRTDTHTDSLAVRSLA
jgi:hypothetical protein